MKRLRRRTLISILLAMVLAVGVAFFILFSNEKINLFNTYTLLIIAGTIKYIPFASRSALNSMLQISNEIEDMLLAQQTRYKIPAGLPEGVLCGNKTGEMDATENDAAIIYAKDCDYILVVLSNGWSSKDQVITRIQSVSSLVYDYLNGDENGQEE